MSWARRRAFSSDVPGATASGRDVGPWGFGRGGSRQPAGSAKSPSAGGGGGALGARGALGMRSRGASAVSRSSADAFGLPTFLKRMRGPHKASGAAAVARRSPGRS